MCVGENGGFLLEVLVSKTEDRFWAETLVKQAYADELLQQNIKEQIPPQVADIVSRVITRAIGE
jgi:hypothetical protein